MGFALSDEFGEDGRDYFHRLSSFYPGYSYEEANAQYNRCLTSKGHGITIKTLFYLAQKAGVPILGLDCELVDGNADSTETTDNRMPTFSDKITGRMPGILQKIIDRATDAKNADIMLLGAMTVISSCLSNVYGIYGSKISHSNLFTFVAAKASAGKGDLALTRNIVKRIHKHILEQYKSEIQDHQRLLKEYRRNTDPAKVEPEKPKRKMLIIPANSSSTAFYEMLDNNNGVGLMMETEGDTLADTFKKDYGNYSDGFRKIFHHETISYLRRQNEEYVEIDKPRLSVVLTGTPCQILTLIKDTENGLFSRFIFYYLETELYWKDQFADEEEPLDKFFDAIGDEFFSLYETLNPSASVPIKFDLTAPQKTKLNKYFKELQQLCYQKYGDDMIPTVRRLGVVAFRLVMILTTLRTFEQGEITCNITCDDEDFESAMIIVSVIIEHNIKIYKMLRFSKEKPTFSNENTRKFFEALPERFNRQKYIETAKSLGINPRTAEGYVENFVKQKTVVKEKHDHYMKPSQNTLDVNV